LWPWLSAPLTTMEYVMYFRFVDDVMFAHNQSGKGDANTAYTQSDSSGAKPGRSLMSTTASFVLL